MMEVKAFENKQVEVVIDGIPIGYFIENENGKITYSHIYDNYLWTIEETEYLEEFIKVIRKQKWARNDWRKNYNFKNTTKTKRLFFSKNF